jgi:threonine/homoserine/homoserine lactone efflux protein
MIAPPATPAAAEPSWVHHGGLIGTTFLLTMTNPAPLLGFIAIFSSLGGLVADKGYLAAAQLVAAVTLGSFLWWTMVARAVSYFRERLNERRLAAINRFSGAIILVFGVIVLADLAAGGVISAFVG